MIIPKLLNIGLRMANVLQLLAAGSSRPWSVCMWMRACAQRSSCVQGAAERAGSCRARRRLRPYLGIN